MIFSIFKRSLAGPGYVILNIIRVLNIIALIALAAASVVLMFRNIMLSTFFVFEAIAHVVTVFICAFLIISETSFFRNYFARNWPLLSLTSGFVTLGVCLLVLGIQTLGFLNKKDTTSQDALGLSFWQIVVAAGVVAFIMGFVNIAASYLFRTKSVGVTARMVRAYGATAQQRAGDVYFAAQEARCTPAPSHTPSVRTAATSHSPARSFTNLPADTLPSYHPPENRRTGGLNISAPMPDKNVQQPEMAAHPAFQNNRF